MWVAAQKKKKEKKPIIFVYKMSLKMISYLP